MRHLVTGGAGFLGSHLCDSLIAAGHDVICLDNLFTGHRNNIAQLLNHPRFEFVRGDVCQEFHFEVDRVWHLACPASPVHYQRNGSRTLETGIVGTLNAVKLAQRVGGRILLTSTSEVYGDPLEHPQREEYRGNVNHNGPRACYDTGKCAAEAIVSTWAQQYGVDVRIARLFNSYGPRMALNDGRVVSNFIVQALRGESLTVYGDGDQTRSFCYGLDTVTGIVALMDSDARALPVNIGNPGEFTMLELARMVRDLTGSRSDIVHAPLPVDDPVRRRPDISRAKALLGWEPTVDLEHGLVSTIAYFKERLRSDVTHLAGDHSMR